MNALPQPCDMPDSDHYHYGIATLSGRRAVNEDSAGVFTAAVGADDCLAIVADGLGGHRGGREASNLAVREFVTRYRMLAVPRGPHCAAQEALAAVNQLIHTRGSRDPNLAQMGTTFTALILLGAQGHIVHIGDTRAYRLHAGRLEQLTHDHNLAAMGRPNVLYRALGTDTEMEADHEECAAQTHDRFLLCSDGVHGVLPEKTLTALLSRSENVQACAEHITEAALQAGSQDNVTAVVVEIANNKLKSEQETSN